METKITERDKILLILLVILIIIFGAVMIPNYGIMASINAIKETNAAIRTQRGDNETALKELVEKGIDSGYAENAMQARRRIEEEVLALQYDAVKMSQMSLSADSTSVAREWLLPIAYVNYENGTDTDKLLKDISINTRQGYNQNILILDGYQYLISSYPCTVSCHTADDSFDYETTYMEVGQDMLCDWVLAHNILIERGSVNIATGTSAWNIADDGNMLWSLELDIPQNSQIEQYKHLLGECHHCGQYYSLAEYQEYADEEVPMVCPNCEGELTGESIR